MIIKVIWIALLIVGVIVSLRSLRWGLLYYLIGALIFPVLWVGEIAVRFELVYCLWLLFLLFVERTVEGKPLYWHSILSRYGSFLVIVVVATLITIPVLGETDLFAHILSFYGMLRPLLVMLLFSNVSFDEKFLGWALWVFVWLSIPLALLTIGQSLGIDVAERITLSSYTSPWRTPVFGMMKEIGMILRGTGVFESPVYNATYFLFALNLTGFLLVRGHLRPLQHLVLYFSMGLAFAGGIATLSSTFLVGLIVSAVLFVLFVWPRYKLRFLRFAVISICIVVFVGFLTLPRLSENSSFAGPLRYQVERIMSGSVLETRYDPKTGILKDTYQSIMERPIFGWGLNQREGIFTGDSLFISLLYTSGIIGLICFLWTILSILMYTAWRRHTRGLYGATNQIIFLFSLLLLATGVGQPSFFVLRVQECYWALVGMGFNRELRFLYKAGGLE